MRSYSWSFAATNESAASSTLVAPSASATSSGSSTTLNGFAHALNLQNLYNQIRPQLSWRDEAWLLTANRYERIATASPRVGLAVLGCSLVDRHIAQLPTLRSPADFVPVHGVCQVTGTSQFLGSRPKLATWPVTKHDKTQNKEWAV